MLTIDIRHLLWHQFFILAAMDEQDFFYTIDASVMAEFKDRGSRFLLTYAYPVQSADEFKILLQQLKRIIPKPYITVLPASASMAIFRASDDG